MNSNFFQATSELHIDNVIKSNPDKKIVLIFSVSSNFDISVVNATREIKKKIKHRETDDKIIYLFIDLRQYTFIAQQNGNIKPKYMDKVSPQTIPFVMYYYGGNRICEINNCLFDALIEANDRIDVQINEQINALASKKKSGDNKVNARTTQITEQIKKQQISEKIDKMRDEYMLVELDRIKKTKELEPQLDSEHEDDSTIDELDESDGVDNDEQ